MKLIWTLLFLILTSKNYSQDSLIAISKLPWISIKAMPFPLTYGITFGYGYLGMIEKFVLVLSLCELWVHGNLKID